MTSCGGSSAAAQRLAWVSRRRRSCAVSVIRLVCFEAEYKNLQATNACTQRCGRTHNLLHRVLYKFIKGVLPDGSFVVVTDAAPPPDRVTRVLLRPPGTSRRRQRHKAGLAVAAHPLHHAQVKLASSSFTRKSAVNGERCCWLVNPSSMAKAYFIL